MDQLSLMGFIFLVTFLSVFAIFLTICAGFKLWKTATISPSDIDLDFGQSLYYIPRTGSNAISTPEGIRSLATHVHHHVHVHERSGSQLPSYTHVTQHIEDYPSPAILEVMKLETPPPHYEDVQRSQQYLNYI